jgi:hypothetical protein
MQYLSVEVYFITFRPDQPISKETQIAIIANSRRLLRGTDLREPDSVYFIFPCKYSFKKLLKIAF